ncbi:hypothetical protein R3Q08_07450 [Rhodococcus erythropolis]|uniref:hypothetical protein n=1 Tax=Rhodococcus TaxID=1827 RepID=UPI000ADAFFB4|nr:MULTISPECIES: hypothetical protein [Rhodococcus]MDV6208066.1 hypothetical protein [Rhodococcus erythropolis]
MTSSPTRGALTTSPTPRGFDSELPYLPPGNTSAGSDRPAESSDRGWDPASELSSTSKGVITAAIGLALLIAAFAVIGKLGAWAGDYGTILVYLAFFLWMSIAGRLFWWGADTLITAFSAPKSHGKSSGGRQ